MYLQATATTVVMIVNKNITINNMAVTITKNSVEIVSRLLRTEFDRCLFWQFEKAQNIIDTALEFGLNDLADEMTNDL